MRVPQLPDATSDVPRLGQHAVSVSRVLVPQQPDQPHLLREGRIRFHDEGGVHVVLVNENLHGVLFFLIFLRGRFFF